MEWEEVNFNYNDSVEIIKSVKDFEKVILQNNRGLTVLHANIRSMHKNFDSFLVFR